MHQNDRPYTIALEEHYLDPAINAYYRQRGMPTIQPEALLEDFTTHRLREMDEAGIDVQVLSHAPPGLQRVDADSAGVLARDANDRLAQLVQRQPSRFAAFASLPTALPEAAADELERAVLDLGFKGAMLHGLPGGRFLDHPDFRPIFARAERLGVPIYLHPADPHPDVAAVYFSGFEQSYPNFLRAAWGFTIETGTQAMRLVLSGLFDEHPGLQIILGHLGETIPFLMERIDEALGRDTKQRTFRNCFTKHFYVTTSGFFSDPAFFCCVQEMGIERVLFSVDWPYASNKLGMDWIDRLALPPAEKRAVQSQNAARLLKLQTPA